LIEVSAAAIAIYTDTSGVCFHHSVLTVVINKLDLQK